MSPTSLIFDLIDFRSFSNLWYWIALCVIWSSASHWVVGVPHDMVWRARREGGEALVTLETLVQINARRMLWHSREYGAGLVGGLCFLVTMLVLLAALYRSEFALAFLLILLPLSALVYISLQACLKIEGGEASGEPLLRRLFVTRVKIQALGLAAIFVAAMVGMYVNLIHLVPQ